MIEQIAGYLEIVCDECATEFGPVDLDIYYFRQAIDQAREAGWLVEKIAGEWFHTCPECAFNEITKGFTDA